MSEDGGKEAFVRAGHTPTEPKARKSQSWSLAQKTVAQHICRQSSTAKLVQWEKTAHSNVMNPTPPHAEGGVQERTAYLEGGGQHLWGHPLWSRWGATHSLAGLFPGIVS